MSTTSFASLNLRPALLNNLATLGYQVMTPIQAQSLPLILQGADIIAQAKTGSGKTAAFALGLLQKLEVKHFYVQSLVLCPTRELADQVAKDIRKLARAIHNIKVLTLCGGMPWGPQRSSLEHGAHIIVGTPGRVEEHVRKGTLTLHYIHTFVLDEADRMLDMGFQAALDAIVEKAPVQRQTLLFSATYPKQIQRIAERIMTDPIKVQTAVTHDSRNIEQHFYKLEDKQPRMVALCLLLLKYQPESTIVFCNTKREVQDVANELVQRGFSALALQGDLEQKMRDQTLVRFANKSTSVLVATDVAARGLDIAGLDLVINYQISRDLDMYIHRIGRTGRSGSKGIACTLYSDNERYKFDLLAQHLSLHLETYALPPYSLLQQEAYQAPMKTLQIDAGKKQKVRPGDILGALTAEPGIESWQVGKIQIFDYCAYVAVVREVAKTALKKLTEDKLKGRSFRVRQIRG